MLIPFKKYLVLCESDDLLGTDTIDTDILTSTLTVEHITALQNTSFASRGNTQQLKCAWIRVIGKDTNDLDTTVIKNLNYNTTLSCFQIAMGIRTSDNAIRIVVYNNSTDGSLNVYFNSITSIEVFCKPVVNLPQVLQFQFTNNLQNASLNTLNYSFTKKDTTDNFDYELDNDNYRVPKQDNLIFTLPPYFSIHYIDLSLDSIDYESTEQITFNESTEYYSLTQFFQYGFDYYPNRFILDFSINGIAIVEGQIIKDYGFIRAYKVNKSIMNSITSMRYQTRNNVEQDIGEYIHRYTRYPFNIDTVQSETLVMGWYDSEILTPLIDNQFIELTLFDDVINGFYENINDLNHCTIKIALPYYDIIELDNEYINTRIKITYKIDIIANTCLICIYSNNNLINMFNTQIGFDIPFITTTERVNTYQINSQLPNNNIKGIINVYQKKNSNNLFTSNEEMQCNLLNGFNRIELHSFVNNNDILMKNEIDLIKQKLLNGVIF